MKMILSKDNRFARVTLYRHHREEIYRSIINELGIARDKKLCLCNSDCVIEITRKMNRRIGRSATIEATAEATRSVGGGDAFCMPPDKETPRCPISEMSVTARRFPLAAFLHPYRGVFRTLSLILSCFSVCFAPSLWISLSFFSSFSLCCCLFLFRLISLAGTYTRSKTRTINLRMKPRYWINERIYRAITRMNRIAIVYQCWKKVNVLLPARDSFERCENFANYERKNMCGHGMILSCLPFSLLPSVHIRMQNVRWIVHILWQDIELSNANPVFFSLFLFSTFANIEKIKLDSGCSWVSFRYFKVHVQERL